MREKMKSQIRKLWTYFVFGVAMCLFVSTEAQAQTYTRPSKGASVTVLSTSAVPASPAVTTYTSAMYEMSSFAEVQINTTLTYGGTYAPDTRQVNVAYLPRYIKIVTVVDQELSFRSKYITMVYGANSPTDTFNLLQAPSSYDSDAAKNLSVVGIAVYMSPLPYSTTQYIRPLKGNPVTIRPLYEFNEDSDASQREPILDMRAYSGLAVQVHFDNVSAGETPLTKCNALPFIRMEGAIPDNYDQVPSPNDFSYILAGRNNVKVATLVDDSYVFNSTIPWLRVEYYAFVNNPPGGVNCSVSIKVTPLPLFTPPDQGFRSLGVRATSVTSTSSPASALYYTGGSHMRVENTGLGAVCCTELGCFNGISAAGKRDGSSVIFDDFGGDTYANGYFDCVTTTATAGTIQITTW